METTREIYHRAKQAAGCETDYAFAKKLGLSRAVVSTWANGHRSFDDDHAETIAGILGVEPGYIMACANAERARSAKSKSTWARVAALLIATGLPPAAETELRILKRRIEVLEFLLVIPRAAAASLRPKAQVSRQNP